jgi:sugar O-acyltransferase (sialic acid O-acetyltransferase NeuD family)
MIRLAVLGASGHGVVVGDTALSEGWRDVVFYDNRWPELQSVGPWSVIGTESDLLRSRAEFDAVVVAIGDNRTRLDRQRELAAAGIELATLVHPSAVLSPFAQVGPGSVVFAGTVINAFAIVGAGAIINTGATVDHECVLADGVHLSPGAHLGGNVHVGEASWIGIGAAVRQNIVIGANVIVGVGAVVVKEVPDNVIVFGVPARVRRSNGSS